MNRKYFFRVAWALTLLLALTMGCKLVNQAQEVISYATEIGGLATDIDLEGLATDVDLESLATSIDLGKVATNIDLEGLATDINVDEVATQMAPLITQMGSMLTDMPGLNGTPFSAKTPSGFPSDIPVMEGEKLGISGSASEMEYTVDAEFQAVVDFYRREMKARGWAEGNSRVEDGKTRLVFQKGNRAASIEISEDFIFGTAVKVTVQG